jgi:uncharacterized protein (UPF0297 family)
MSDYINPELLEHINNGLDKHLKQKTIDAINQCIGHVLSNSLQTEIKQKIEEYLNKNISKVVTKVVHHYIKSHQNGGLERKIIGITESALQKLAYEWVKNNFDFNATYTGKKVEDF